MAKYTERYIDYIKSGGKIPTAFALIENFETLFLERFANREIGFETEDEFFLRLDLKADLLIPLYKERIERLKAFNAKTANPEKVSITKGNTKIGIRRSTEHVLPYDVATSSPSSIATSDPANDTVDNTNTITGLTLDEAIHGTDWAKRSSGEIDLIGELLERFEPLFMRVF